MNEIVKKYDGDFTRLTISQKSSSATSDAAIAGITYELTDRRGRGRASVCAWVATDEMRRGRDVPSPGFTCCRCPPLPDQVGARREGLHRDELLTGLLVDRDRRQVRV